jgi:hypothetical protein
MHCHSRQLINDTSCGLTGQSVYAKMRPPQQPIQLTYCTASVSIPKRKGEHPRRRYVSLILTCLQPYWSWRRCNFNITEDFQPQCTRARATALCRLFAPSLGHQSMWVMDYVANLQANEWQWTIDIAPKGADTASPLVICTKPWPTHWPRPRRFKPRSIH